MEVNDVHFFNCLPHELWGHIFCSVTDPSPQIQREALLKLRLVCTIFNKYILDILPLKKSTGDSFSILADRVWRYHFHQALKKDTQPFIQKFKLTSADKENEFQLLQKDTLVLYCGYDNLFYLWDPDPDTKVIVKQFEPGSPVPGHEGITFPKNGGRFELKRWNRETKWQQVGDKFCQICNSSRVLIVFEKKKNVFHTISYASIKTDFNEAILLKDERILLVNSNGIVLLLCLKEYKILWQIDRNGNRFEGDDQSQSVNPLFTNTEFRVGSDYLVGYESSNPSLFSVFALKDGKRLTEININPYKLYYFQVIDNLIFIVTTPFEEQHKILIYDLSKPNELKVSIDVDKNFLEWRVSFLYDNQRFFLIPSILEGIKIPYLDLETYKLNTITLSPTQKKSKITEFGFTGRTAYGYNDTNHKFTIWDLKTGEELISYPCKDLSSIQLIESRFILEYNDGEKSVIEYKVGGPLSWNEGTIDNRVNDMALLQPLPQIPSNRGWEVKVLLCGIAALVGLYGFYKLMSNK
jgi:F-box domain